jgi:8-oxo-dGTP pyrophosphatase MutT (NUDIX family)
MHTMEPLMKEKRWVAAYIPYQLVNGVPAFFLQKRSKDAKRAPGVFGMFGGGIDEGETSEQGLMREVQEELTYIPVNPVYFSKYETADQIFDVYLEEVGSDFESKIKIEEGEYGKFLTSTDIKNEDVSPTTRLVTEELTKRLKK